VPSGANKTKIMYRANLNFHRSNRYLSEMLDKGLLETDDNDSGRIIYIATERGKALLETLFKALQYMLI